MFASSGDEPADCTKKPEAWAGDGLNPRLSSSSSPWSKLKDPRIVRVQRALGGKDRHSKVHTVKGLRDRRVRLSVPTAIKLYELQDRIGLNQPSKVFDWLLDAAKDEIEELPPLQIPPDASFHDPPAAHELRSAANNEGNRIDAVEDVPMPGMPPVNFWNSDAVSVSDRSKRAAAVEAGHGYRGSSGAFCYPRASHVPSSSCNPYQQWEASDFASSPATDLHQFGSQVLLCPPVMAQPYFPGGGELGNPRQMGHFPMANLSTDSSAAHLQSSGQSLRPPFHLSMVNPSQNGRGFNKDDRGFFSK